MSETWYSGATNVLVNLANNLISVEYMLTGASYLMGIAFGIKAIVAMKIHGEQRSSMGVGGAKEGAIYLVVSAMLLYYPTAFEVIMNSTFGYSSVLAYAPMSASTPILGSIFGTDSAVGPALATIIQVIGLVAFLRGWLLIARSASGQGGQPGTVGKGFMHVFGGVLAMNIIGTLEVFHNTLFGT
ncbi:MAG: type IV secretion protein IcmC [Legionellales bacterium]|nr:type IV secretion protein IcmC [Legionellales bacterium]